MNTVTDLVAKPTKWTDSLRDFIEPYWSGLLDSEFVESVAHARLTVPEMQGWILNLYPFIHSFPKFLAEALIKVEDEYSRSFLIDNIKVEKAHAEHWVWMGNGFGISREEMIDLAEGRKPMLRDVQSLTDWLWYINTKGSLAEAVAATSYAIEGITGDMARKAYNGFESYRDVEGVDMNPKTYKWLREHAHYDDQHPKIALKIVERYAVSEKIRSKAMLAAKRSLQLLHLAFDTSYRAYTKDKRDTALSTVSIDLRDGERRELEQRIGFPERRFADRRGRAYQVVA